MTNEPGGERLDSAAKFRHTPSMHAWVAGATGLVGSALVRLLLEHPRVGRVTTLVRRSSGERHEKLHERVVSFETLKAELAGMHATHVFCCLGTTIAKAGSQEAFRRVDHEYPLALGEAAAQAGAEAFLVVTAMGASSVSKVFYNRVKGELERDLSALPLRSVHVFRPSLLLGERAERRTAEEVGSALAKPLGFLMVGPLRKYRPIAGEDVARAMLAVALGAPSGATGSKVTVYESDRIADIAAAQRGHA